MTTTTSGSGNSGNNSDSDNSNNNNRSGDDDDVDAVVSDHPRSIELGELSSSSNNRSNNTATSAERRRRVLFGVLFRLLVNGRDQRRNNLDDDDDDDDPDDRVQQEGNEEEEETTNDDVAATASAAIRPLRILTPSEAESLGAICRICFEGASTTTTTTATTNDENPLLSPCNCSGGSQWIHKQCLRQWQRYCTSTNNSRYCNVCQTRYTLRPPRLRTNFEAGNILVYLDTNIANGTFSKTLVLIVNHRRNHSTFGLIINSPINQTIQQQQQRQRQSQQQIQNDIRIPSGIFDVVSWRRGGPVCGGRLGVTRYIVAHTLPLNNIHGGSGNDEGERNPINIDGEYVSQSVLPSDPRLHFIYSQDDTTTSPTTFDQADLQDIIQKLADLYRRRRRQSSSTASTATTAATAAAPATTTTHLFLFAGYSQWGRGQLCREISRGAWGVCEDGSLDDMIRPLNSNYYDLLVNNNVNSNSNSTTAAATPPSSNSSPPPSSSGTASSSRRLLLGSQLIYEED